MLELEVGEVAQCSFEFAFVRSVETSRIGEVFKLQAEIVVVEAARGQWANVKLSELLIEGIRPVRGNPR